MKFCDCEIDGYCPRYGREMNGRMREICAAKNVDLGTAAAFREQWKREYLDECTSLVGHTGSQPPTPILLRTDQAPGDALVATAAIYSLHKAHPGKYLTAVVSPYPEVFQYNPDVVDTDTFSCIPSRDLFDLQMHYPAIHQSNQRGIHVMQAFCEHLGKSLDIEVPLLTNRPHLFFKEPVAPPAEDFWLICSGGKNDFTNKMWGRASYQSVVNILHKRNMGKRRSVKFVQVGETERDHPQLSGCTSRVGLTNLRQLFELTRRSRGVLCGVTLLMHVAAALDKPAIIVAGGREPVQWNAYPRQHYLHTVGALPCYDRNGKSGACWRSRVIPLGDNTTLDEYPCLRPVETTYAKVPLFVRPECMEMITPEEVANLVLRYNARYND